MKDHLAILRKHNLAATAHAKKKKGFPLRVHTFSGLKK
jgi:hypothetical protein